MPQPPIPTSLTVRTYGDSGPRGILLHGGPGAAGSIAPVARGLSDAFQVIEPFQRRREHELLTVQRHIDDLHDVLTTYCSSERPALVGHSWGAMLALVYAAQHPDAVRCIVLIGCGTFDRASRAQLQATIQQRITPALKARFARLHREVHDPDVRLCVTARLFDPLYVLDALSDDDETEEYDSAGHLDVWRDMLRLQERGIYPAAFTRISVPVLMVHGDWDPHPGRMTFSTLQGCMPQIEYTELQQCGHYPWREKAARDTLFEVLRAWLGENMT